MKLAIDCRMIGSGGIGSYIAALVPHFLRENRCVLVGRSDDLATFRRHENAEIFDCDVKCFSLREIFAFPRAVLSAVNSCDAFFSPYCNLPGGIRIPIFTTIHDVVFLDVPLASKVGTFVRKIFYQRAIRASRTVFTVSKFSKSRIETRLQCKSPVVVTYNAVPDWLENGDVRPKTETLLFVGNIKRHKGLSVLLDAFRIVREKIPAANLLIVGNSANFRTKDDKIEAKFRSLDGVGKSYEFTGKISNAELKRLYEEARLLIMPSFYEGFGMPPLEAMQSGTRAVISDIDVFREIYENYPVVFFKTGDAADLAEKIIENYGKNPLSTDEVPQIYSFARTAKIIIGEIRRVVKA